MTRHSFEMANANEAVIPRRSQRVTTDSHRYRVIDRISPEMEG